MIPEGYALQALIPLTDLAIVPEATRFSLECMVAAGPARFGSERSYYNLFHAITPGSRSLMHGRFVVQP